jgi:hypothetical protein
MSISGPALSAAAYAACLVVTSALVAHVVAGNAEIQNAGVSVAESPVRSGAPRVLTITVDGAIGPLTLYCATTTDRMGPDEVNVSAAEVVDFYREVCSRPSSD